MSDEEFDLEKFADLFDTAMSSKNPAVQRALKNLMMIAALVEANEQQATPGPLRTVLEEVKRMNRKIDKLEYDRTYTKTYNTPAVGTPWTTGAGSPFPPGTIIGSGTYTTGTASSFNMADIDKLKTFYEEDMKSVNYDDILSKWEKKYD